jgi:hypothetical protein
MRFTEDNEGSEGTTIDPDAARRYHGDVERGHRLPLPARRPFAVEQERAWSSPKPLNSARPASRPGDEGADTSPRFSLSSTRNLAAALLK